VPGGRRPPVSLGSRVWRSLLRPGDATAVRVGGQGGLSSPAAERLVAAGVELATDRLAGAGLLPTTALPDYPSWRRALVGKSGGSHARLVVLLITLSLSLES
jgi:hypothetical protein